MAFGDIERTLLPTQTGVSSVGNTVWTDTNLLTLPALTTERVGLHYTTFPFDAANAFNQTAEIYRSWTLRLGMLYNSAGLLVVFMVDEVDPPVFDGTRIPGAGTLVETEVARDVPTGAGVAVLDLDLPIATVSGLNGLAGGANIENNYKRNGFSGRVALTIGWVGAGNVLVSVAAESPRITTLGAPFHSGVSGANTRSDRRGFIDEQTGQISVEDRMVRDGYTKLRVLPENYDPPRPPRFVRRHREKRTEVQR